MTLRVGVLAVQGAVGEHLDALHRAAEATGLEVDVLTVRSAEDLDGLHGLVLPGGESTTISRLLRSGGLQEPVVERARAGVLAVFGTCAGMVLLCAEATQAVAEKDVRLLGLLDAEVDRNAFGRQRDSFESAVEVAGVGRVPAVFIRAPVLTRVWGGTQELARTQRGVVAAQKGLVLATAFHPELTGDTRLHERFLRLVAEAAAAGGA